MKKIFYLIFIALISTNIACAKQKSKSYVIGFYNLENLFDTYHDEGKYDEEFLPDGANQWTEAKYQKKLANMAHVIKAMAKENKTYHTVLGVSEIENRHVLEDLVNEPEIQDANFQIVHYDGPDRRGVDVALLYDPTKFIYEMSESIPFTFDSEDIKFDMNKEEQEHFRTRDVLMVKGKIDGEDIAFFVAHLPSRIGGKGGDLRSRGAEIIHQRAMKLQEEFPGIKIVVMGDMNDNPTDESMIKYMDSEEKPEEVDDEDEFFSPFLSMLKAGFGSLAYRGTWNIYDIILVNKSLVDGDGLKIIPIHKKGYYGRIFKKDFLLNQSGQYKGTPYRTFSNGAFINGYSDHLPTYIVISK